MELEFAMLREELQKASRAAQLPDDSHDRPAVGKKDGWKVGMYIVNVNHPNPTVPRRKQATWGGVRAGGSFFLFYKKVEAPERLYTLG